MTGTPVQGCPHIFHVKFGRSSDVWVCEHGTGYPDLCEECRLTTVNAHGIVPVSPAGMPPY